MLNIDLQTEGENVEYRSTNRRREVWNIDLQTEGENVEYRSTNRRRECGI